MKRFCAELIRWTLALIFAGSFGITAAWLLVEVLIAWGLGESVVAGGACIVTASVVACEGLWLMLRLTATEEIA